MLPWMWKKESIFPVTPYLLALWESTPANTTVRKADGGFFTFPGNDVLQGAKLCTPCKKACFITFDLASKGKSPSSISVPMTSVEKEKEDEEEESTDSSTESSDSGYSEIEIELQETKIDEAIAATRMRTRSMAGQNLDDVGSGGPGTM